MAALPHPTVGRGERRVPGGRSRSSAAESRRPGEARRAEVRAEEQVQEKEVEKEQVQEKKGKRGGKTLRRIKTFLRREKKYVVGEEDAGSSKQYR